MLLVIPAACYPNLALPRYLNDLAGTDDLPVDNTALL